MMEYTTAEVVDKVGDITADSIRKFAKNKLVEDVEYKKYGRTLMITDAGLEKIIARNTKPGRRRKDNGGEAK